MIPPILILTASLNGILDFVVPLYCISCLYVIYQYQISSQKAKLEAEAQYKRKVRVKVIPPQKDWKELVSGFWKVSETENIEEWLAFHKITSSVKKYLFPTVFHKLKHETILTDSTFQFNRYMQTSTSPNIVVKMKLYTTEEEALEHAKDCQEMDCTDNSMKSFASFINEEEKTLTTIICPVDMSGSKIRLTHIRKIVDEDCLSVVSSYTGTSTVI